MGSTEMSPNQLTWSNQTKNSTERNIKVKPTAVGDVEPSSSHGVVRLELQPQYVSVTVEVGGVLGPREASQDGGVQQLAVLHGEEVVRRLQVKVVEGQVDPAAGFRDDDPHTVQVVPIALWVVRGQHSAHGRREVGETWDCGSRKRSGLGVEMFIFACSYVILYVHS